MVQEKYIRDNNINIMSIEIQEEFKDDFQLKMLTNTNIDQLLPCVVKGVNNEYTLNYNISSKQPLSRVYEANRIDIESFLHILKNIAQIMKAVSDYLLDLDHILLNPRFIYMDMNTKKIYFTYYPDSKKQFGESLKELFEFILEHFDHSDKSSVVGVYNAYHKIIQGQSDIAGVIQEIIQEDSVTNIDQIERYNTEEGKVIEGVIPEVVEYQVEENSNTIYYTFLSIKGILGIIIVAVIIAVFFPQYSFIKINIFAAAMLVVFLVISIKVLDFVYKKYKACFIKIKDCSDTIPYRVFKNEIESNCNEKKQAAFLHTDSSTKKDVVHEYIHTQLLSEFLEEKKKEAIGKLVSLEEQEEIIIESIPFVIGSDSKYCSYVLDSRIVSRMHLKITKDTNTGEIFMEDLNSTNGTYLNHKRIESGKKERLENKDYVRIGLLKFQFVEELTKEELEP